MNRSIELNEKFVFRDLPIGVRDDDILEFLIKLPEIVLKTDVINGRIRDNGRLTQLLSGEKFVYVKGKFYLTLHNITHVNDFKFRIWHKSQQEACLRCRHTTHRT